MDIVKITHEDGTLEYISKKTRDLLINLGLKAQQDKFIPTPIQKTVLNLIDDFFGALDNHDEMSNTMSPAQYISEYRTLKIQMPRQTGKTTLLSNIAAIMPESVVVVTPNANLGDMYKRQNIPTVTSYNFNNTHVFRGKTIKPKLILLDEYNRFDRHFSIDAYLSDIALCISTRNGHSVNDHIVVGLST